MTMLTDFSPEKPTVEKFGNGYYVPLGLNQIERPNIGGEGTYTIWQGYFLEVPALTEREIDKAIATLPAGDYSADKQAALDQAAKFQRLNSMNPTQAIYALEQRAQAQDALIAALQVSLTALETNNTY